MTWMGSHTPDFSWMDEKPYKLAEFKLDAGQQEHIYEASTKGDTFSNPSGDNVKSGFSGDSL